MARKATVTDIKSLHKKCSDLNEDNCMLLGQLKKLKSELDNSQNMQQSSDSKFDSQFDSFRSLLDNLTTDLKHQKEDGEKYAKVRESLLADQLQEIHDKMEPLATVHQVNALRERLKSYTLSAEFTDFQGKVIPVIEEFRKQ